MTKLAMRHPFSALLLSAFAAAAIFEAFGLRTLLTVVGFAIIFIRLHQLSELATFRPYEVTLRVNFDALCKDLALQWMEHEKVDTGVFTAITPALFHHDGFELPPLRINGFERRYKYLVGIAIQTEVPCAKIPWQPGPGSSLRDRPFWFFHRWGDEYRFGVQVDPEWWKHHKEEVSPQIRDLCIESDGTIVLASLPAEYIPDHIRHEHDGFSGQFSRACFINGFGLKLETSA